MVDHRALAVIREDIEALAEELGAEPFQPERLIEAARQMCGNLTLVRQLEDDARAAAE